MINPTYAMINQLSFKLTITSPNGYGILSTAGTTVLATPPLKLGSIDKISIVQTGSLVTNALTRYDMTFRLHQTLGSEFELLILLPEGTLMQPPTGVIKCSNTVAKKNFTCHATMPLSDGGYIQSINVSDFCAVEMCALGSTYSITLTNVVNVDYARQRLGMFTIETVTARGYLTAQGFFPELNNLPPFVPMPLSNFTVTRETANIG